MQDCFFFADHVRIARLVSHVATGHGILSHFEAHDPLVDGGMTSLAMVDLMLAIERDHGLLIPDHELSPANFNSIESIASMVARLSFIGQAP